MQSSRSYILLVVGIRKADVLAPFANTSSSNSCAQLCKANRDNDAPCDSAAHRSTIMRSSGTYIEPTYASVPSLFVDLDTHQKNTNLLCWHCSLPFENYPRFVPLSSVLRADNRYEWNIEGNFCSWSCAAAFANTKYSANKAWEVQQNMALIRARIDGTKIRAIRASPPKTIMRMYSGADGVSQQDYLAMVEKLSNQ